MARYRVLLRAILFTCWAEMLSRPMGRAGPGQNGEGVCISMTRAYGLLFYIMYRHAAKLSRVWITRRVSPFKTRNQIKKLCMVNRGLATDGKRRL